MNPMNFVQPAGPEEVALQVQSPHHNLLRSSVHIRGHGTTDSEAVTLNTPNGKGRGREKEHTPKESPTQGSPNLTQRSL